jgi:hypothetical protein
MTPQLSPPCNGYDEYKLERSRFAALNLSQGDLLKLSKKEVLDYESGPYGKARIRDAHCPGVQ